MTPQAPVTLTPNAAPTRNEATDIARNARGWLAAVVNRVRPDGEMGVRAASHILIAAWIADSVADTGHGDTDWFPHIADRVAWTLNSTDSQDVPDSVTPMLALLVELLLASQGHTVEPFHTFFAQTVSLLERADPALESNRSLMQKRALLHHAGVLEPPKPVSTTGIAMLINDFRLSAPASEVDALTLELECLTMWGTRSIAHLPLPPGVGDLMAGFAVDRLRHYDLISAARLLRLLESLATSGFVDRRDDLYRALLTHRRDHGPFGWYGPEAAKLAQIPLPAPIDRGLLAATELYLPATLECLWTVAEVSLDGWRLLEQVPIYAGS